MDLQKAFDRFFQGAAQLAGVVDTMLAKTPIDRPRDALNVALLLNKIADAMQSPSRRVLQQTDLYDMREMPKLYESQETDVFF